MSYKAADGVADVELRSHRLSVCESFSTISLTGQPQLEYEYHRYARLSPGVSIRSGQGSADGSIDMHVLHILPELFKFFFGQVHGVHATWHNSMHAVMRTRELI